MKRHRRGVRSTRVREETEPNLPAIPKAKDVYIKIYNVTEMMHTNQTGQQHQAREICDGTSQSRWKLHQRRTDEE